MISSTFKPRGDTIGIPWYCRETYAEVKAAMRDAEAMPGSYDEWLDQAQRAERQILREGRMVARVFLTVPNLSTYCLSRGLPLASEGRVRFATEVANGQLGPLA